MERLLEVMRTLRRPGGCPWDQEQTHASLRTYLLEEAAEAVDALTAGGTAEVVEELGDVLLQVAFHAVIAEEEGTFGYGDIEEAIVDKLVRRHPHVFGNVRADDADQVVANWQAMKAAEGKGGDVPAERVPLQLPTLMRAAALDEALGWRPSDRVVRRPLAEAAAGAAPLGEALLALVHLARRAGLDPEMALRDALAAELERSNANAP